MKKNKILVLLLSLSLVFFYGCPHPNGSDLPDPDSPSAPESPADPTNPGDPAAPEDPADSGDPADPSDPEKLPAPETGAITITAKEGSDFVITKSESNGKVVLTADKGYSNYKWYVDADFTVVSETDTYEFTPSEGCTMVFVTARKDGVEYSATYYVFKK